MRLRAISLAVCLELLAGCATAPPPAGRPFTVTAMRTPFYRYGPAQTNGADFNIPKDTLITLLRRQLGFSQIQLMNGSTGYVSTDDIGPAPANLTMGQAGAPLPGAPPSSSQRSRVQPEPERLPQFTQPDEVPLPKQTPSPGSSPAPSPAPARPL